MSLVGRERQTQWLAGKLPEVEARRYMTQLFDGLAYCHSCNAAHRDLKVVRTVLNVVGS